MSPMTIFFLGVYIGACAGAVGVLFWWYRCDCRDQINGKEVQR